MDFQEAAGQGKQPVKEKPQGKGSKTAPDMPEDKYKLNLGFWRLETLNEILEGCARKYLKAVRKKDEKSIKEYQALVNTLFTETYVYMEQETGFEEEGVTQSKDDLLKNILDEDPEFSNDQEAVEHLRKVRDVYLSVRTLLQDVGLDIPKQEQIDKTDIFE